MHSEESNEWVCDWCNLYGSRRDAELHHGITGHEIRELDPETTAAVREKRRRLRIERAATFVHFTRVVRGTGEARDVE